MWTDCRTDACIICIWQGLNICFTKKQSQFLQLSHFPWTTRWQFPVSNPGLSVPVCSRPAAVSSTVEARICLCMLSATQTSCGAINKSGFRPVFYLKDIQLWTFKWQPKKFPQAPWRVLNANKGLINETGSPCHVLLTQNFTRKKAFWGPFPNSSFRPPFFSGNLS